MKKDSFLTVCMNPGFQKTLSFPALIPDTVNRTGEYRLDVSGKGINVSRVLSQLGKEVCHLTQLGGFLRPFFLELCEKEGLRLEWVESGSSIRFCYTLLDRCEKSVTELVEESERVGEGTESRLLEAFSGLLDDFSTLIISGTKAAGFTDNLIPEMVREGRGKNLRIILDIRGQDLLKSLPYEPDIIKPNLYEFISTFAPDMISQNKIISANLKESVSDICRELYKKFHCALVLTRGGEPVWYAEKGELEEYSFDPVEPLNTTGSGDAFTAGFAAALEDGASLREAVINGVRCGALNAALFKPGII